MANLLRMDLYRMRKSRSFRICLGLAFFFALARTPFSWLLTLIGRMFSGDVPGLAPTADLAAIIASPYPLLNAMLAMLSASTFFYADMENGYIKNIAGQMPKKGYTVLSKFIAVFPHNLLFMLAGITGNLIGTVIFQRIVTEGSLGQSLLILLLKILLLQSICAVLLLVTASLRSKSLGSVLSVLLGTGIMSLVYLAVSSGISRLLGLKGFDLNSFMPDQLLSSGSPDTLTAILSAAVTTFIFLPLSIRIFDRRDVK